MADQCLSVKDGRQCRLVRFHDSSMNATPHSYVCDPKNVAAIKQWFNKHRPDMAAEIDFMFSQRVPPIKQLETIAMLMLLGFEAGREFQLQNPEVESGMGYLNG